MNLNDISSLRLISQQIAATTLKTPKDLVSWMGAMQAQDFNMAKWALGVRLPGSIDKMIEESFNRGDILRTHVLRPTWHFISADDIYWMLELTAPHIKAAMRSRHKELGLTETVIQQSNKVIERTLSNGEHLTRNEIMDAIKKAGIITDDPQAYYHLMLHAELDGIICSATIRGKEQTCALLAERAPKKKVFTRDEALAELAKKYFTSHGPATLYDFVWWSGLPVADARKAIELSKEMSKSDICSEKIGSQEYWFSKATSALNIDSENHRVYLLPAYDEFIISYKDRSPSLPDEQTENVISSNGIFRPVIVANGRVIGLWKRTTKTNKTIIYSQFFQNPDKSIMNSLEKSVEMYGHFLNQKTEIAMT